jgi:hypothetical protein
MSILPTVRGLLLAAVALAPLAAYNPPTDTAGPLTARIEAPDQVTDATFPVKLILQNSAAQPIEGHLRLTLIDRWTASPDSAEFHLAPNATREFPITITTAPGSYNALYPIHALAEFTYNGAALTAHPIAILKTQFPNPPHATPPIPWRPIEIAPDSGYALWRSPIRRVVIQQFDQAARTQPLGWDGTDPGTHANVQFNSRIKRSETRECITMHEPYAKGPGIILAEYPLALPQSPSIHLRFANSVRDDTPNQAPGDGVTFRVRVLPFDAPEGREGEIVFERHNHTAVWQDGEADLTRFAGRSIRLQLENHPGPRNNTTNDAAYWAEPTLIVGNTHPATSKAETTRIPGSNFTVTLGVRGLLDATVTQGAISFHGFQVRVLGDELEDWRSTSVLVATRTQTGNNRLTVRHTFRSWAGTFDLVGELYAEQQALRVHWSIENVPAPKPWLAVYIESASAGPFSQAAHRIYLGDGNVLQDPAAFSLTADGHRLSTSYVGLDFAPSASLVEAVDAPPSAFEADPDKRIYALRAAHDQTMTFIPSDSAWTAAIRWHDLNGLHAAGGVKKLAGRFVFDLWGGRSYSKSAEDLAQAFRYGLTDSLVVWHDWQRWGYDYRLPDILPPNPKKGSAEDFIALAQTCKKAGVLFAPHDNYIDFYPDATNYSYDQISFTSAGAPVKAWFNKGRDAQSYRWRPDLLMPVLQSNVTAIRNQIAPTAYFIDVWSSAEPHDYWTRNGEFHDRLSTRKVWKDAFSWIRQTLGDNAPTISEAGHDQLIGGLDGGQANHLRVDTPPSGEMSWTVWPIKAADSERIPWFDAAHHDRFVKHGAGYENRYVGGLDTPMHGIYSDDYITTEVLDGHPAMVSTAMGRDVVRKYWLLHDLMSALALARMKSHEFVGDNLHRQHVKWDNGGEVWINRGAEDWTIPGGHTLPQYGFYARVGSTEAAIERRDGVIVEWSRSPQAEYFNARPFVTSALPLTLTLVNIEDLGNRQFRFTLDWNVSGPIPEGYRTMVHFTDASGNILFQGDHAFPGKTAQTSVTVRIPDTIAARQSFELRTGLYSPADRANLIGLNDDQHRLRLATIEWTGDKVAWKPLAAPSNPFLTRFNRKNQPINFGPLTTTGALRLTKEGTTTLLTPLPGGPAFEVRLTQQGGKTMQIDPKIFHYPVTN